MYHYGIEIGNGGKYAYYNCVLIVLLWNWNEKAKTKMIEIGKVLIVLSWNLNIKGRSLKIIKLCNVLIVPYWNWNSDGKYVLGDGKLSFNCTIMELKCRYLCNNQANRSCVLIVPLWNWNLYAEIGKILTDGFNCTILELKWNWLCHVAS